MLHAGFNQNSLRQETIKGSSPLPSKLRSGGKLLHSHWRCCRMCLFSGVAVSEKQQKCILTQFWRLEVWNQVGRAVSPPKVLGEDPSLSLPASGSYWLPCGLWLHPSNCLFPHSFPMWCLPPPLLRTLINPGLELPSVWLWSLSCSAGCKTKLPFLGNLGLGWEAMVWKEVEAWGNETIYAMFSQELFLGRTSRKAENQAFWWGRQSVSWFLCKI